MKKIKLAVFGDSFSDHFPMLSNDVTNAEWKTRGWPGLVASSMSDNRDDFIFAGRSGTSVWYAYSQFLDALETHDLESVVFCYTFLQRVPYLPNDIAGDAWRLIVPDDPYLTFENDDDKFVTYMKYFYDPRLHLFISRHVYKSVNQICKQKNIKLVNILPFQDPNDPDKFVPPVVEDDYCLEDSLFPVLYNLYPISRRECGSDDEKIFLSATHGWIGGVDQRLNHMNDTNNKVISQALLSMLDQNQTFYAKDACQLPGLDYSEETWQQFNTISTHTN